MRAMTHSYVYRVRMHECDGLLDPYLSHELASHGKRSSAAFCGLSLSLSRSLALSLALSLSLSLYFSFSRSPPLLSRSLFDLSHELASHAERDV